MKTGIRRVMLCVAIGTLSVLPVHKTLAQEDAQMPWAIAGTGGAYLLAEPGELEIEFFKRDLNVRGARGTDLRVIFFGPDREVLEEVVLPSTGGGETRGPLQSETLTAQVDRPGIYGVMLSVKGDRHGTNIEWSFNTNAESWVIETSRGHRDERHREPIVLTDPDRPADINFLPRAGEFEIEVEALPADCGPLTLYDETGAEVAEIPVVAEQAAGIREYMRLGVPDEAEASARVTIPADENRRGDLWRLHLPRGQAFVEIDGLTRWASGDLYANHCVWTPDADSWFQWLEHRWLISPYRRTVYAAPGEQAEMTFAVHNNGPNERTVALELEFPGAPWPAELSEESVTLEGKQLDEVTVTFEAPADGEQRVCHVRATPAEAPEFTTYATLTAIGGESPVGEPLDLPLVLEPWAHENRQFGYLPEYPVDQQVYFDLENRGYVV
ncbi:MAG: hypothetical protein ACQER1_05595, partial [Armatimonadota bacterium]